MGGGLTAEEPPKRARLEDRDVRQQLKIGRKIALNAMKDYKNRTDTKRLISRLMFECLLDTEKRAPLFFIEEQ